MYSDFIDKLSCPHCYKSRLDTTVMKKDTDGDIEKGLIVCTNCNSRYPINDYILEFLPRDLAYKRLGSPIAIKNRNASLQKIQQKHFDWYATNTVQDYEQYSNTTFWHCIDQLVIGQWRHEIKKDRFLLDVGCAQGRSTFPFMKEQIGIVAFDISREMVRLAAKKYKKSPYHAKASFMVADASVFPVKTSSFDYVLLYGVLHHLPDSRQACREIYRVLKKHGIYFGLENNKTIFRFLFDFFQRLSPLWYEEAGPVALMSQKDVCNWFSGLQIHLTMSTLVFVDPHLVNLLPVSLASSIVKATNSLGQTLPLMSQNGGLLAIKSTKI